MKKYLKKVLFLLIAISSTISSLFVYAEENYGNVEAKNTWGSQKGNYYGAGATSEGTISDMGSGQQRVNASGSISGGHAIFIKLLKYNSNSKTETIVGTPILLYTGGFLDDITNVDADASSATISGGTTTLSSTSALCAGNCENTSAMPLRSYPGQYVNSDAPISDALMEFFNDAKVVGGNLIYTFKTAAALVNGQYVPASSSCTGSTNSVYGPEETSYYKRKDIKFKFSENSGLVGEGAVTIKYTNVALGSVNLYDYIRKYLVGAVSGFSDENSSILRNSGGIVTIDKLQSAFKASINMVDLDDYYLSFEPAVREITNNVVNSWMSTQTSSGAYGESKWNFTCDVNKDLDTCAASVSGECSIEKTRQIVWAGCTGGGISCYYDEKGRHCSKAKETCWGDKFETYIEKGTWSVGGCCGYRNSYSNTLISAFYEKESIVKPARISIRNDVIQNVTTSTTQSETKHCILDKNNNCTNTYEYFIGPNLNTAITGTTNNNKYYLYNGTQAFNSTSAQNNAVGVSYWWLSDLTSCKHECPNSNDLSCIENYCDNVVGYDERANTQKLKASCMLNFCGYSYTRVNCSNSNPYAGMQSSDLNDAETSTCSNLNSGLGNTIDNGKTRVTCESDRYDANPLNEIFDQKTYINVACKEKTSIGFKDISRDKIVAGSGIEYYVTQIGNKECTVFWDTETFKFAYASYHSQDEIRRSDGSIVSTRTQLLNMLNYFNSAQTRSINSAIGIDLSGEDYSLTWNDIKYNKNLTDVSKVTEIVNNTKTESSNQILVKTYDEESSKLDVVGTQTTTTYEKLTGRNININKYLNNSDAKNTYTFDKYCISSDGKATVTKADSSGICYTLKTGEDVYGRNVYYTNINATPNSKITNPALEHAVTTTVSDSTGTMYTDYCPYNTEEELKCIIDITPGSGTEMHGNSIYVGSVNAELLVIDKQGNNDEVSTTSIVGGGSSDAREIKVDIQDPRNGNEKINIVGTVTTKNGKSITCSKSIHIINPSPYCGVSCDVVSVNTSNDLYRIVSTGIQTPKSYQSATSNNFVFVKAVPDVRDSKYYVRNSRTNPSRYVYGKVEGNMTNNGTTCYNICWNGESTDNNCPMMYKPADITGIKNYCIDNWNKDINDYESVEECQIRCRNGACPVNVRDLSVVRSHCTNYAELGYSSESACVNYCYYNPNSTDEYVYRPVNNNYPFPDGTRTTQGKIDNLLIGSNWIDKEQYITDDNDDLTSVTGVYANQTPEYVIDLDKEAIKNIRSYVTNYNESKEGANAYLDYVYASNTDKNGKYYSAFINSNGINQYFKMIDGKAN